MPHIQIMQHVFIKRLKSRWQPGQCVMQATVRLTCQSNSWAVPFLELLEIDHCVWYIACNLHIGCNRTQEKSFLGMIYEIFMRNYKWVEFCLVTFSLFCSAVWVVRASDIMDQIDVWCRGPKLPGPHLTCPNIWTGWMGGSWWGGGGKRVTRVCNPFPGCV